MNSAETGLWSFGSDGILSPLCWPQAQSLTCLGQSLLAQAQVQSSDSLWRKAPLSPHHQVLEVVSLTPLKQLSTQLFVP